MSIHAPYNFVPLSAWIYKPEWGHLVSHDVPFSDGISGALAIEIEAHTPLLIGGLGEQRRKATDNAAGAVHFYQTPNEQYAIPGSSLKGMIRNVLEIATFGKMRSVDDRALSVRDLTNGAKDIYREHLTETLNEEGARVYRARAKAGWLKTARFDDGRILWELTPCHYARVEQDHLIQFGQANLGKSGLADLKLRARCLRAVEKYQLWGEGNLNLRFGISQTTERWPHQNGQITLVYKKANPNLGTGNEQGTLVFTGQPGDNDGQDGRKHMEFIFYGQDSEPEVLGDDVIRDFIQIHGQSDSKDTQAVWDYWNGKLQGGEAIPVFYLEENNKIASMGFAMMYRLAYQYSIAETIAHTNPGHIDDSKDDFDCFDPKNAPGLDNRLYDLPELLFGTAHKQETNYSLRSRVSFAAALVQAGAQVDTVISTKELVLSNPKPTYYPSYIHQPGANGETLAAGKAYRSYMDPDAEIRGWKRYPAGPMWNEFNVTDVSGRHASTSKKTKTVLHPLAQGACFCSMITVHNLRPTELGALVWALTWGNNPDLRHSLGMGKPYGLGQVSIRITAEDLEYVNPDKSGKPDTATCLGEFTKHINAAWQQATKTQEMAWEQSEQVTQLLAMANPRMAPGGCRALEYMAIDPNEFQQAKGREQGDAHYVLMPYVAFSGASEHNFFQRPSETERRTIKADKDLKQQVDQLATEEEKFVYTELHRKLFNVEQAQPAGESCANDWCDTKLRRYHESDALKRLIAEQLKRFYVLIGKWPDNKLNTKQKKRVNAIKQILGE